MHGQTCRQARLKLRSFRCAITSPASSARRHCVSGLGISSSSGPKSKYVRRHRHHYFLVFTHGHLRRRQSDRVCLVRAGGYLHLYPDDHSSEKLKSHKRHNDGSAFSFLISAPLLKITWTSSSSHQLSIQPITHTRSNLRIAFLLLFLSMALSSAPITLDDIHETSWGRWTLCSTIACYQLYLYFLSLHHDTLLPLKASRLNFVLNLRGYFFLLSPLPSARFPTSCFSFPPSSVKTRTLL